MSIVPKPDDVVRGGAYRAINETWLNERIERVHAVIRSSSLLPYDQLQKGTTYGEFSELVARKARTPRPLSEQTAHLFGESSAVCSVRNGVWATKRFWRNQCATRHFAALLSWEVNGSGRITSASTSITLGNVGLGR